MGRVMRPLVLKAVLSLGVGVLGCQAQRSGRNEPGTVAPGDRAPGGEATARPFGKARQGRPPHDPAFRPRSRRASAPVHRGAHDPRPNTPGPRAPGSADNAHAYADTYTTDTLGSADNAHAYADTYTTDAPRAHGSNDPRARPSAADSRAHGSGARAGGTGGAGGRAAIATAGAAEPDGGGPGHGE